MKKLYLGIVGMFLFILSFGMVNAIDVNIDNYYPTPVEAGEYLNIWLKISNRASEPVENAVVKLKQTFPFSLDPGEPEEQIIELIESNGGFVLKKFKIQVDGGAVEGDNKITFQYADYISADWKEKTSIITVVESQTSFDVVLQELNEEGVYIAIANIGKNPANAVTVRIPEQEHFKTQLVSASIVGNLESGDYTLVGFNIIPKSADMQKVQTDEGETKMQRVFPDEMQDLLIQVDYTDPLGVRRTIIKNIEMNPNYLSANVMDFGTASGRMSNQMHNGQGTGLTSNMWFWVSVGLVVLYIGRRLYRRKRRR